MALEPGNPTPQPAGAGLAPAVAASAQPAAAAAGASGASSAVPRPSGQRTIRHPDAPSAKPRRRANPRLRRLVMLVVWAAILFLMVAAALMLSAWLTGFTLEGGFPDVMGMIGWIRAHY